MMTFDPAQHPWTSCSAIAFLLICCVSSSGSALSAESLPLFSNHRLIEATIEAPFDSLMDERNEDRQYEGLFTYSDARSEHRSFDVKLRVRGKFRARKRICDFAPIRLNFRKKQLAGSEFQGQDKLKLVTHCQRNSSHRGRYLLKEYLTYRFFAALTDNSFRVRLLRITYIDSDGRRKTRTRYAFLIESEKQLAKRLGAGIVKATSVDYSEVDHVQGNLVAVFEYFIGNTDFSAVVANRQDDCCHNIVLYQRPPSAYLPVPYDFDFAGIVDAPYAAPNPRLPIDGVTERLYRGLCLNNHLLEGSFQKFRQHRKDFHALIDNTGQLDSRSKRKMMKFMDRFYRVISEDRLVEREFLKECYARKAPSGQT